MESIPRARRRISIILVLPQGFYSVLGSVAGMLSGMLLAGFTLLLSEGKRLPSKSTTAALSAAIFLFSVIIALLPVVGSGYVRLRCG